MVTLTAPGKNFMWNKCGSVMVKSQIKLDDIGIAKRI